LPPSPRTKRARPSELGRAEAEPVPWTACRCRLTRRSMSLLVLAVSATLVISFFCSMSEATLLSVRQADIEAMGRTRAAQILRKFRQEIDVPIAAILVLNTVANTMGAAVAGAAYVEVFGRGSLWTFTVFFTIAILIFSEIVPKTLGVTSVRHLAAPVARAVSVLIVVLRPILSVTRAVSGALRRETQAPVTSLEEIRLLAALGRTEGVVGPTIASMIEGVAQLKSLKVWDAMVPRGGVVFLSGQRTIEENIAVVRQSDHSRFPYTRDGDLDHVEGIVLAKELLFALHDTDGKPDLEALAGKPLVVPESASLESLLRRFQDTRRHLAIVVDEYGGTQGIVTLEDVLEEIVGEIHDESDRVDPFIHRRPDGALVCRGWAEARKIFDAMDQDPPEGFDAVSVGGLVSELLGRVPRSGENVDFGGLRFSVLSASQRRADRILVMRKPSSARPEDGDQN
jgi:CBS domain containing-hemolysin-like protein